MLKQEKRNVSFILQKERTIEGRGARGLQKVSVLLSVYD